MTQNRNLSILADQVNSSGVLGYAGGGTGLSAVPTNGQLNIGNGSGFTRNTISAGTGISVSNGAGTITITNTSPSSGGTVTSVATNNGLTGGTITTSGTLGMDTTTVQGVGGYALMICTANWSNGGTLSGANLYNTYFIDGSGTFTTGFRPSGTWRNLCGINLVGSQGCLAIRTA